MAMASAFLVVESRFDDFADTTDSADHLAGFQRHEDHLAVVGRSQFAQRVDVFLGDEVVDGLHVTGGDRFGHYLGGAGLCLGLTFAGFGLQERGLASTFGFEDLRLLLAFGGQDRRCPQALGFEDLCALDPLGFHLARHGGHQVGGWADVLDLDPGDLDAPRRRRLVDGAQQFR